MSSSANVLFKCPFGEVKCNTKTPHLMARAAISHVPPCSLFEKLGLNTLHRRHGSDQYLACLSIHQQHRTLTPTATAKVTTQTSQHRHTTTNLASTRSCMSPFRNRYPAQRLARFVEGLDAGIKGSATRGKVGIAWRGLLTSLDFPTTRQRCFVLFSKIAFAWMQIDF